MMIKNVVTNLLTNRQSLQSKTLAAAFWSFIGSGGRGAIRFASNLILTRLLFPEAFGLMAMAMVVVTLIQVFSDTGVKTALIQNPNGRRPEYVNSSFIIAIVRSVVLFFIILLAIEPVVSFYNQPQLRPLLWIMSFALLAEGFINPGLPLVIKDLRVEKQVIYAVGSQFAGFISTVILVYFYRDVKAVAVGYLLTALYRIAASYLVIPYRPKLQWDRKAGKELLHFGKYILVNTMITWAVLNLDRLVIGKTLDMEQLGYYNIALYIGLYISEVLVQIFSQSFFPALSSAIGQPQKVRHIYRKTMSTVISLVIPTLMLIVFFSKEIIAVIYDPRYLAAGVVLFWISLKSIFNVISNIQSGTLLALGKPLYVTISMAAGLLFLAVALPVLSSAYGLSGGGIAVFAGSILIAFIQALFLKTKIGFSFQLVFQPWFQTAALSAVLSVVYLLLKPIINNPEIYNLPFILLMGIVSLSAAALSLWKSGILRLSKIQPYGAL